MTVQNLWHDASINGGPTISTSISPAEAERLRELAGPKEGGRHCEVLEVGSAFGYSTILMALAGAKVCAVDPHNGEYGDSLEQLQDNLTAYQCFDRVQIVQKYSQNALPILIGVHAQFDVVFIDGDHTKETVTFDAIAALSLVRPGGVIAFHDYNELSCPGVRQALDVLFVNPPGRITWTLFEVQR